MSDDIRDGPSNRNRRNYLCAVIALLAVVVAGYLILDISFTDRPMPTGRIVPSQTVHW
jgi:hypothetical protein